MPIQPNVLGRNRVQQGFGSLPQADYPEQGSTGRLANVLWLGTTLNATPTELFLGGIANNRFIVDATTNCTGILTWQSVANNATTIANSHVNFGAAGVTSAAGTIALLANSTNTKMPTAGTPSVALTADNTNKALVFTGTGTAAETCYWEIRGMWNAMTNLGWAV